MISGRPLSCNAAGEIVGNLRAGIAANRDPATSSQFPLDAFTRSLIADQQEKILQDSLKAMRQAGCGLPGARPLRTAHSQNLGRA